MKILNEDICGNRVVQSFQTLLAIAVFEASSKQQHGKHNQTYHVDSCGAFFNFRIQKFLLKPQLRSRCNLAAVNMENPRKSLGNPEGNEGF